MEKAWIGVGVLGLALGTTVLMQALENRSLNQRMNALEAEPRSAPQVVKPDEAYEAGSSSKVHEHDESAQDTTRPDEPGNPQTAVPPEVLREAVRKEQDKERQERSSERKERFQEFQDELVRDLADSLNWNEDQQAEVRAYLTEASERRMELREQVRDGELNRSDAREMMQEIREEIGGRLEEAVGVEGVEAIVERLPGRRGR